MASRSRKSTKSKSRRGRKPRHTSVLQVSASSASAQAGLPAGALLLFGGLCLLVAAWGVWLLFGWFGSVLFTGNERFTLHHLEARTDGVLPEPVLLQWSGVEKGANVYEVDLGQVRERLENHAIVREAVVRRQLPDTLSLMVNERVPIARMGRVEGRMNWLVDAEGVLIQKSFQSKHLPFLLGVRQNVTLGDRIDEGPGGPALRYLEVLRDMPAKMRNLLQPHVIGVGHPDYLDWRTRDGYRVLLPRDGEAEEVLERASRGMYEIKTRQPHLKLLNMLPEGRNKIGAPE